MSRKTGKPWDGKWKLGNAIGHGGQGQTFVVRRHNEEAYNFVLKKLLRNDDAERRARMCREVTALHTLEHHGIVKLVDSNTERYKTEEQLYLVTELVPGGHPKGIVELDTAVATTLEILTTLKYCHAQGVVHRDIKPDNIMLRDGQPEDPVLLDFGLSFNLADLTEFRTETGQNLGPRNFINLPELNSPSASKRDPVSDITQLLAVFFFMLTGIPPVDLLDHEGRKPHERPKAREALSRIPNSQAKMLQRVFDVGFSQQTIERWPSASALANELDRLNHCETVKLNFPEEVSRMRQAFENSTVYRIRAVLRDVFRHFENIWLAQSNYFKKELEGVVTFNSSVQKHERYLEVNYDASLVVDTHVKVTGEVRAEVQEAELVVSCIPARKPEPVALFSDTSVVVLEHVEKKRILALDPNINDLMTYVIHEILLEATEALKHMSDRSPLRARDPEQDETG